ADEVDKAAVETAMAHDLGHRSKADKGGFRHRGIGARGYAKVDKTCITARTISPREPPQMPADISSSSSALALPAVALSVVVPVRNEAGNIAPLIAEIDAAPCPLPLPY